jgi:hypothetical protein
LQETWASKAEYFSEDSFYVILSGTEEAGRSYAGVGFVVAPWCRHLVHGFLQYSDRLSYLKLRVWQGKIALVSAYAPHNLKPYDQRHQFYVDLGSMLENCSVNGPRYIYGDFNARLGKYKRGEEHILGPHGFGEEAVHQVDVPNRDLLMEFCTDREYVAANTFQECGDDQKVTFTMPGCRQMGAVSPQTHAMLDLLLAPSPYASDVVSVLSIREACLATDHFLLLSRLQCPCDAYARKTHQRRRDRAALIQPICRRLFPEAFVNQHVLPGSDADDVDASWAKITKSMKTAEQLIPFEAKKPNKPWITAATLGLIADRSAARARCDNAAQKLLHRAVRNSVRTDRSSWLNAAIADGTWASIRSSLRPRRRKQGRLRNATGELVSSESRAETMAAYLEQVQWKVRPATVIDEPTLGPPLPVIELPFGELEVGASIRRMAKNKATGPDDVPAEYWQRLADNAVALAIAVDFLNACWNAEKSA